MNEITGATRSDGVIHGNIPTYNHIVSVGRWAENGAFGGPFRGVSP